MRGARKQSSLYGIRCNDCHDLLEKSSATFMKNKRAKLIKKGKMLKGVEEIRDGVIVYNESNIHSAYVTALVRTTDLSLLSPEGILLRTSVLSLRKFFEDMEKRNKPHKDASNFITEKFLTVYEKHGNKREKGNTSSLQKTKSLLSRWFGVKKEPKKNSEGATVIERGSVIQIAAPNEYFIVFEVWKTTAGAKTKYGKWFPSPVKDNPKWPAEKQSLDKYRFGVREVILDENKVALKSGIVDGRDVRKTYRLFEFSQVKTLLFKVDGL